MSATDRLRTEKVFHDRQALERREYYRQRPEELAFDEDAYLDHESWVRRGIELLGPIEGRRVLDYGCGHGMAAALFAGRGGVVTACDLSPFYLEEASHRAAASGLANRIAFVQADAERLPFRDRAFDAIWGSAILHHLDLPRAAAELARVLQPAGVAVFCEPWGANPFLEWARRHVPYPQKFRTLDEQPLRPCDLRILHRYFGQVRVEPFQLLSMARRLWPQSPVVARLEKWDARLLRRFPALGRFCRYVVLAFRQPRAL